MVLCSLVYQVMCILTAHLCLPIQLTSTNLFLSASYLPDKQLFHAIVYQVMYIIYAILNNSHLCSLRLTSANLIISASHLT